MKTSSTCAWLFWWIVASLTFTGCQGSGQTVNFDPRALSPQTNRAEAVHEDDLTIVVEPFKDARPQPLRLGLRTHLWGGTTNFSAWNGKVSEGMADLAIEYLNQRQFRASRGPADPNNTTNSSNVTLSGTVLSLQANAKSGFGFTDIDVDMRVRFEAKNHVDGSSVRMVLGSNGTNTVVTFAPSDVEQLINLVAKDLYKQLFQDLTVKDRAFHLQPRQRS